MSNKNSSHNKYEPPKLQKFGTVAEITQANIIGTQIDGAIIGSRILPDGTFQDVFGQQTPAPPPPPPGASPMFV